MDERSLVLLRRRLESLSYHDPLEAISAPLVAKLLDDLIRTTDSYRLIKAHNEQSSSEITGLQTKLDIVKQECSRLSSENNQLHAQLIAEADRLEGVQKSSYQQLKRLEDQIADLSFWKSQAVGRYETLEKENSALKRRVTELVSVGEKRSKGGYDAVEDAFKLSMGKSLDVVLPPPQQPPASLIRLQSATDARIGSLQRQLEQRQTQLEELQQLLEEAQGQVKRRDAEVKRLSACMVSGPDVERLELERRADANSGVILALTQQVDQLTAQVAQLSAAAEDKTKLEAALKTSDKARLEAQEQLRQLRRHNSDTQRDVTKLQQELAALAVKQAKTSVNAAHELDTAMATVGELKADLAKAKVDRQQLQEQASSAQAGRKAAEEKAAQLQAQVEQLQFLLDEGHARADALEQQVSSFTKQPAEPSTATQLEQQQQHQQLASLQQQLATQEAAMEQLLKARDEAQAKLTEAKQRLQAESAAAARYKESSMAAETRATQLASELAHKEAELAAAQEASEAAGQQLKAANATRQQLTAASSDAQAAAAELKQQSQGLLVQLRQAQDKVEELSQERVSLQAECSQLRMQLAAARSDVDLAQQQLQQQSSRLSGDKSRLQVQGQQLGQLQELQHQVEELQRQLADHKERLAASEARVKQATLAAAVKGTSTTNTAQHMQELQQLLDDVTADKDAAEALLQEARAQAAAHAAALRRAESERDRALSERKAADERLEALRASLDKGSAAAAAADARTSGLQGRLSSAHQQLSQQEQELERLHGLLAAAEDAAKAARGREEAARAQQKEYAERARRAETLCEEADAELAQLKAQLDECQAEAVALQQANARLGADLTARSVEVEQLKTLSIAGHTTLQDYTEKLKAMSTELRGYTMKVSDLEAQVRYKEEALSAANVETANLHKALRSVDAERDQLQSAVDDKDATISALQQDLEHCKVSADDGRRQLAAAEGRVAHVNQRAAELSAEVAGLQEQLGGALQQLGALEGEHAALKDEFRAMAEDMEALVRENQVVSTELATASHHGAQARDDVTLLRNRLTATEQLLRSKEAEVEDVRHAYEGLAVEHRRAQSTLLQLEREGALRESALAAKSDEVASLQEGLRGAQMQINQYLLDLQAYERQVDHLSRQLSRDAADTQQVAQDRETLLEELRAAQQVRLTLERNIEDLQRQLASLDAQNALLQARLGDSESEVEGLQQRAQLERGRVVELEALLANIRAKEFRSGMDSQKAGGQLGVLTERNKLLQQQVTTLQQQVTALQQSRDVQDRELARLKTEALELAQRTAAATAAAGGGPGGQAAAAGAAAAAQQVQRDLQAALDDQATALQRADHERRQLDQQLAQATADNKRLLQQLKDAQSRVRGTGSSGGSRLGPPDTSYRQQWEAAESRVGAMQEEMAALQERAQHQEQQLVDAKEQLVGLSREKSQLLEMLSQLDAEKSALSRRSRPSGLHGLQQQHQQQQVAPGTPTSLFAGSQLSGSGSSMPGGRAATSASIDSLDKLQARLQEEQQKRQKAERDFLSLMTSIEQDSSRTGSRAASPRGPLGPSS